jgi:hypothetical protein
MIDYADDAPDIYRSRVQRARNSYKCEECSRDIKPGEHYHYAFMVYEKRGDHFRSCEHCAVAIDWLMTNCGGFAHGGVWEDYEEHIIEYPDIAASLMRLVVGRRRRWRRFDGTGLMRVPPMPKGIPA